MIDFKTNGKIYLFQILNVRALNSADTDSEYS